MILYVPVVGVGKTRCTWSYLSGHRSPSRTSGPRRGSHTGGERHWHALNRPDELRTTGSMEHSGSKTETVASKQNIHPGCGDLWWAGCRGTGNRLSRGHRR